MNCNLLTFVRAFSDSDKKEHQGWGGDDGARELDDEAQGLNDARAETSTAAAPGSKPNGGWAAAPVAVSTTDDAWATAPTDTAVSAPSSTPAAAAPAPAAPEPEPEDNTKTLEEYLAERMASTTKLGGDLQTRKANEGADESQWRDGVALLRKGAEEDSFYVGQKVVSAGLRTTTRCENANFQRCRSTRLVRERPKKARLSSRSSPLLSVRAIVPEVVAVEVAIVEVVVAVAVLMASEVVGVVVPHEAAVVVSAELVVAIDVGKVAK